jgi:quaternary ammonium compound-resistance protein SugE
MHWLLLLIAGLFEIVWTIGLKLSMGFSRPLPSLLTLAAVGVSFYCLSLALRGLPLGTAYAVWVGIGAIGATLAGILMFGESATPMKIASLALVAAGIIGLKLTSVDS